MKNARLLIAVLALFYSPRAVAREVRFTKRVDPGALQAELTAAGIRILFIECSDDRCTIHLPDGEKKDPMPVVQRYVYADPHRARQELITTIKGLSKKWDTEGLTEAEKDELLKKLVRLVVH